MRPGRPKKPIVLSHEEEQELKTIAGSRSLPHGLVARAKVILMSAAVDADRAIATQLGYSRPSVILWRKRYRDQGLSGLHDELRPGCPRSISDERIAELIRKTLKAKPVDGTHWSTRSIAKETHISRPTVQRIWSAFGLQPHRQRHLKTSNDPFFVEKVRDIVGLYLNPPFLNLNIKPVFRRPHTQLFFAQKIAAELSLEPTP